ncbi:Uncharacterised protein [uncultured archaeon]|nr:Uncharacterised protein [uncultured archaeon]
MQRLNSLLLDGCGVHSLEEELSYFPINASKLCRCVVGCLLHQLQDLLFGAILNNLELVVPGFIGWYRIFLYPFAVDIGIEIVSRLHRQIHVRLVEGLHAVRLSPGANGKI